MVKRKMTRNWKYYVKIQTHIHDEPTGGYPKTMVLIISF
jgi:hypothetical protein